ncbi:leucine-rich repeat-containing protein let-4 [Biomphalaria pfeifferi]|uniref:Leucine-rich repeat-containing protein let-4 n=1 Tax=Biomphalaria pfeifferi TaxID=112525 RepID=A0AAD8F8B2_BIOPF|nr:leucine-rich repeat-containing protein let-4 [Biomphalaria pfeifferi]
MPFQRTGTFRLLLQIDLFLKIVPTNQAVTLSITKAPQLSYPIAQTHPSKPVMQKSPPLPSDHLVRLHLAKQQKGRQCLQQFTLNLHLKKKKELTSKRRNIMTANSDTDETESQFSVDDETDNNPSEMEEEETSSIQLGQISNICLNDYVLVAFIKKKNVKYLVGLVTKEEDEDGNIEVSFLRRSTKMERKFIAPVVPDIGTVPKQDIHQQAKVPLPEQSQA